MVCNECNSRISWETNKNCRTPKHPYNGRDRAWLVNRHSQSLAGWNFPLPYHTDTCIYIDYIPMYTNFLFFFFFFSLIGCSQIFSSMESLSNLTEPNPTHFFLVNKDMISLTLSLFLLPKLPISQKKKQLWLGSLPHLQIHIITSYNYVKLGSPKPHYSSLHNSNVKQKPCFVHCSPQYSRTSAPGGHCLYMRPRGQPS